MRTVWRARPRWRTCLPRPLYASLRRSQRVSLPVARERHCQRATPPLGRAGVPDCLASARPRSRCLPALANRSQAIYQAIRVSVQASATMPHSPHPVALASYATPAPSCPLRTLAAPLATVRRIYQAKRCIVPAHGSNAPFALPRHPKLVSSQRAIDARAGDL